MRHVDIHEIGEALQSLQRRADSLAQRLENGAGALEAQGTPVDGQWLADLASWSADVDTLAARAGLARRPGAGPICLADVRTAVEAAERRRRIDGAISDVLRLTHIDGHVLPALTACHAAASRLQQRLQVNPDDPGCQGDVRELFDGRHPWCGLLRLVTEAGSLDDGVWSGLLETVSQSLGPSLAAAAARSRLVLMPPLPQMVDAAREGGRAAPAAATSPQRTADRLGNSSCLDEDGVESTVEPDGSLNGLACQTWPRPAMPAGDAFGDGDSSAELPAPRAESVAAPSRRQTDAASVFEEDDRLAVESSDELPAGASLDAQIAAELASEANSSVAPGKAASADSAQAAPLDGSGSVVGEASFPQETAAATADSASIFDEQAAPEPAPLWPNEGSAPAGEATSPLVPTAGPDTLAASESTGSEGAADASELHFTRPKGPVHDVARLALHSGELARTANLSDLIFELIYAGRSGLAFHLARCLEARSRRLKPALPSSLIRVWTLGNAVQFPHGRLAGQIRDDLALFDPAEGLDLGDDNWRLAWGLFVRAAVLRPAVVAPQCGAVAVLRALPMQPEQMQLYNLCARICELAEQAPPTSTWGTMRRSANREADVAALQTEVRDWRTSLAARWDWRPAEPLYQHAHWSLRAGTAHAQPAAANLWRAWLETRRRAEELVLPILQDSRAEAPQLRALVDQLSADAVVSAEGDVPESRTPLLAVPRPEMLQVLREAMTFAYRWLALIDLRPGSGPAAPEALASLRSEVAARSAGVQAEVHRLAEQTTSPAVQAAVGCLLLATSQIGEFLQPGAERPVQESDPHRLLNAELLKCIGLTLDADWEPLAPWQQVEQDILMLLTQPLPDWRTAFLLQERQGNAAACEQLLTLPVWTNTERRALNDWLNRSSTDAAGAIWCRLNEVESLVREAIDADFVSREEQPGLAARLSAVRQSLHRADDALHGRRELARLQTEVEARRRTELQRLREFLQRQDPRIANASDSFVLRTWRKSRTRLLDERASTDRLHE